MSDDVVIVSAARTPVGSFNGALATTPAPALGAVAITAALESGGKTIDRGAGPESGASGVDRRGHSGGKPGLGRQPALRFWPAHRRARLSGHP